MANTVSCPGCAAEFDASGYDPGDQFQCPTCSEIVTVGGAAPAAPKTAKMPSRGGTSRRTASRPPSAPRERTTSKMKVVAGAVGMGALDPSIDPKAIRRAGAAPPPTQDGGDKTLMMVGAGVAAIAIIGLVIYIAKQPSAEETAKAAKAKKAAAEAAEAEKKAAAKAAAASSSTPDPAVPKPATMTGWDIDPAIDAEVGQTLTILKHQTVGENFWKLAKPLLRHGRMVIPALVERWAKDDPDMANASREIVVRMTRRGIPEELFGDSIKRHEMAAVFREWWLGDKGQACVLVSESEFLGGGGGGSDPVGVTPPPDGTNPGGTGTPRPAGGGASDGAIRRDLPQYLANYRTGTFEQRDVALRDIRALGKRVVPNLIDVLKDEDPGVANSAYSVLKELTKQDFGVMPGDVGDRTKFLQSWADWWTKNEATFNM